MNASGSIQVDIKPVCKNEQKCVYGDELTSLEARHCQELGVCDVYRL